VVLFQKPVAISPPEEILTSTAAALAPLLTATNLDSTVQFRWIPWRKGPVADTDFPHSMV